MVPCQHMMSVHHQCDGTATSVSSSSREQSTASTQPQHWQPAKCCQSEPNRRHGKNKSKEWPHLGDVFCMKSFPVLGFQRNNLSVEPLPELPSHSCVRLGHSGRVCAIVQPLPEPLNLTPDPDRLPPPGNRVQRYF